jgi:hypothetical protein
MKICGPNPHKLSPPHKKSKMPLASLVSILSLQAIFQSLKNGMLQMRLVNASPCFQRGVNYYKKA